MTLVTPVSVRTKERRPADMKVSSCVENSQVHCLHDVVQCVRGFNPAQLIQDSRYPQVSAHNQPTLGDATGPTI